MPTAVLADAGSTSSLSVTLKTLDGSSFTVPFKLLVPSTTVRSFVEERVNSSPKGLNHVDFEVKHCTPDILEKVLGYLKEHENDGPYDESTFKSDPERDAQYEDLDNDELMQFLMVATQVLEIPAAGHMAAEIFAARINNKSEEEIRDEFDPENLDEIEEDDDEEEDA
ncbi:hypothetical protein M427DRAFT_28685 [Gonapodya prolifera JEL478]|uniref:SKP1 component POZ domain-containing protein n=1 Tax=Gonapodya prolifera (strain JEL478) TaxID=1344416 RepID=A0A139ASX3_GONPJ|nr:hypothetical protein M427DRAFT_28685 [Gonapodya prolifera JEL478]|eukprot:KXS19774.1 hypothetical protein M427DRAFT_28685 [Gonapodya prolifera JEL478]